MISVTASPLKVFDITFSHKRVFTVEYTIPMTAQHGHTWLRSNRISFEEWTRRRLG